MNVFLSYSRVDKDVVDILKEDLADTGHDVWLDEELVGGQEWWNAILTQIRRCDILLFAATDSSLRSEACRSEARYADLLDRPIIPLRLHDGLDAELAPAPLPQKQWISFTQRDKGDLKVLLRALAQIDLRPLPERIPEAPPLPRSYVVDLKEAIDSPDSLDLGGQLVILHRIEDRIDDAENAERLERLLLAFRSRHDLLAELLPKVDLLLGRLRRPGEGVAAPIGQQGHGGPDQATDPTSASLPHFSESLGSSSDAESPATATGEPDRTYDTGTVVSPTAKAILHALGPHRQLKGLYVLPDIQDHQDRKIRQAVTLQADEPILAVFDLTLFSTGGYFFAITDRRFLHKHESVISDLPYQKVEPESILSTIGGNLRIGGKKLYWNWTAPVDECITVIKQVLSSGTS
jgi:TIR domain